MEINLNNKISFKAGVTSALRNEIHSAKCSEIQEALKEKFNICADFKENKTLAKLMSDSVHICKDAADKYNLPFFLPPKIRVYNPQELVSSCNPRFGFCIGERFKVVKKESEYPERSVFIKNIKDSVDIFNKVVDDWYKMHIASTDSIFAPFIHEIMHNVHLGIMFNKSGFQKGLSNAEKMSERNSIANFDRYIIKEVIGDYAAVSEMELFPEVTAKMITESIDENNRVVKNPMDNLKNFPEFVQSFIKNQLGI